MTKFRHPDVFETFLKRNDLSGTLLIREGSSPPLQVGPNLTYPIASLTKSFVAACVLTLMERQLVSLHDYCQDILLSTRNISVLNGVTLHHLLSHTSGVPDLYSSPRWHDALLKDTVAFADLIAVVQNESRLFAPGSDFAYSNTNYILLGEIIRAVTHDSFRTYLTDTMIQPLGLKRTSVGMHPLGLTDVGFSDLFCDGHIVSCVEDLDLWIRHLGSDTVLKKSSYDLMTTDYGHSYGYGVAVHRYAQGKQAIAHAGAWLGYQSFFKHYPDDGLSVVFLADKEFPDAIEDQLIALIRG